MTTLRVRVFEAGQLVHDDDQIELVSDHLQKSDSMVWVDYLDPTAEDLAVLADELGLHELAVEDALEPHQRPKVDFYETHMFMACRAVELNGESGRLDEAEVDVFVNHRWLITVRHDGGPTLDAMEKRIKRSPELGRHGAAFLLYGLLDAVVDEYFDVVAGFDDFYDDVSDGLFEERPLESGQQRHWFEMRRALVRFHRLAVPMREAVSTLMRHDESVVPKELYPYFQDVYDHILRVSEATDSLRDLVSTIVDTNISLRDYRQNQVMKKVTSWAAIVAVPTLITGFYGMNVPYSGFGEHWGFVTSVGLMIVLSLALYIQFRRRDWL